MTITSAHAYLLAEKNKLVNLVGRGPMCEETINSLGKKLFGSKWRGVSNQSDFKPTVGFHIVNTSKSPKSPGVHWVAIYCTPTQLHVFDSFARNERHLLSKIHKQYDIAAPTTGDHNYQKAGSLCGHISLAWLLTVKKFGISVVKDL